VLLLTAERGASRWQTERNTTPSFLYTLPPK